MGLGGPVIKGRRARPTGRYYLEVQSLPPPVGRSAAYTGTSVPPTTQLVLL